jgi:hypothetical protein
MILWPKLSSLVGRTGNTISNQDIEQKIIFPILPFCLVPLSRLCGSVLNRLSPFSRDFDHFIGMDRLEQNGNPTSHSISRTGIREATLNNIWLTFIDDRMACPAADMTRICIRWNRRPESILNLKLTDKRNNHGEQKGWCEGWVMCASLVDRCRETSNR